MARDLNKRRDGSVEQADVSDEPRGQTITNLAGELATDAYNIVAALGLLLLAYRMLFRNLPTELFTLSLMALGLIAVNVVVTVRRWDT